MKKKITDKQIDAVCERLARAYESIDEAMKMAFALAKDGDERMYQIRGAFSGIREKSDRADGFLSGLGICLTMQGGR